MFHEVNHGVSGADNYRVYANATDIVIQHGSNYQNQLYRLIIWHVE
jgi:hypothetical protein